MTSARQLANQLRDAMQASNRSQREVARALDRAPARISELLRGLEGDKPVSDRLTLVLEMADLLGLEPILVPRRRLENVLALLGQTPSTASIGGVPPSLFDEVFIDLAEDDLGDDPGGAR